VQGHILSTAGDALRDEKTTLYGQSDC
jgi:hypothetical protein